MYLLKACALKLLYNLDEPIKRKMSENNKTEEFLQKLAPCIERGDLDACMEEAARVAREMGVGARELLELSGEKGKAGGYALAYVLALAAAQGLEGEAKAVAYYNSGLAAKYLKKVEKAEEPQPTVSR